MKTLTLLMLAASTCAVLADPEAKVRPFQAEQNFRLLKKTMETSSANKKVIPDDLLEGSGEDDYDYDEDEYEDDDYYDDEESSGFGSDIDEIKAVEQVPQVTKVVADDQDFHFDENSVKKSKDYEDLLYEYYNDLEEDDDEDYLKELEQDLSEAENEIISIHKADGSELGIGSKFLQPSYIFLMLSSALISFAVFSLAFILCRRRMTRQKKAAMVPFVVSDFKPSGATCTPIVKDYQRVPTSTKEIIQQQQRQTSLEMGLETQRPLLTWLH